MEIKFRGELEFLITKMYEKEGVPLPMICIMLEGGSQSIEMALNSLRMGQPLVAIKGENAVILYPNDSYKMQKQYRLLYHCVSLCLRQIESP